MAFDPTTAKPVATGFDPATAQPVDGGAMGAVAKSVVTGVGTGVANVANLVSLPTRPFLPEETDPDFVVPMRKAMQSLGIGYGPDEDIEAPFLSRVGEEVGGAMAFAGPVMSVAKRFAGGNGVINRWFSKVAANPKSFLAGEASAATSAGMGAATAQELFPDNFAAELTGQIAGGLLSPISYAAKIGPAAVSSARNMWGTVTGTGPEQKAAERLQAVVGKGGGDPAELARRLEMAPQDEMEAALTPAQRTGDKGLLALERAIIAKDAEHADAYASRARDAAEAIRREMSAIGGNPATVENTIEVARQRMAYARQLLDTRATQALEAADEAIRQMPPVGGKDPALQASARTRANQVVSEELERALDDAQLQESQMWSRVPNDAWTPLDTLMEAYKGIKGEKTKADVLPDILRRYFDTGGVWADGTADTVKEVQGFRSAVLRALRAEKAKPDASGSTIRWLNKMQEAALESMGALKGGDSEVGMMVREALDFSRAVNDKFRKGAVGKVLRFERTGEATVAPELVLETVMRGGGPKAAVSARQIVDAITSPDTGAVSPAAAEALRSYVGGRFLDHAFRDGKVDKKAAQQFFTEYGELLSAMPDLRGALELATSRSEVAQRLADATQWVQKSLIDQHKGAAGLLLKERPDRIAAAALKAKDPLKTLRGAVNIAKKDPSGAAMAGLRNAFLDEMAGIARLKDTSGTLLDPTKLSGVALDGWFKKNRAALIGSGLFDSQQVARIETVIARMKQVESAMTSGRVNEILDGQTDAITDLAASLVGANIGGHSVLAGASGAQLVMAQRGSRLVRDLVGKLPIAKAETLLIGMMSDPKLLAAGLKKAKSPKEAAEIAATMNAWALYALGAPLVSEEQE